MATTEFAFDLIHKQAHVVLGNFTYEVIGDCAQQLKSILNVYSYYLIYLIKPPKSPTCFPIHTEMFSV